VQITPTYSDPGNVPETFANGPISLNINGQIATIIFTVIRPDLLETMKGQQMTQATAAVASRIATPIQNLVELRNLLNRLIQDTPQVPGSNLKQ
jgi:hypothetical protein